MIFTALAAALLMSGCILLRPKYTYLDDISRRLGVKLSRGVVFEEDDRLDFQGWGYYYAEIDMSAAPLDLSDNENWRELPMEKEFSEFMLRETDDFGRSLTAPENGYWIFRNYSDDSNTSRSKDFVLHSSIDNWHYAAAFYDTDTATLTYWSRSVGH